MRPSPSISRRLLPLITLLSLFVALSAACSNATNDATLTRIKASDMLDRLQGRDSGRTLILDSRPPEQYRAGHIPSAVNLRLEDLATGRTSGLDQYSSIVVYGQNPASATAVAMAKRLVSMGYRDVRLFDGGYDAWLRSGQPASTTTPRQR